MDVSDNNARTDTNWFNSQPDQAPTLRCALIYSVDYMLFLNDRSSLQQLPKLRFDVFVAFYLQKKPESESSISLCFTCCVFCSPQLNVLYVCILKTGGFYYHVAQCILREVMQERCRVFTFSSRFLRSRVVPMSSNSWRALHWLSPGV